MSPNVLIAGWAGSGNLGDELICGSLADLLRRRGAEVHLTPIEYKLLTSLANLRKLTS